MEKTSFTMDDGSEAVFYVLEQTKLQGDNYILVTDVPEGDGEALILKEISSEKKETVYEPVADEKLLSALAPVFEGLLEDIKLI